ncbi:MAG: GTPase [Oscillospiraceae bacterium]|nr:GTPase [Oscillospiraceae bacterium]
MQEDLIDITQSDIPVYLFTGFLEAGKTKFLQETLEDSRFNGGERTLLLMCEEGEEELSPDSFASPNVFVRYVEDEEDLTEENLEKWFLEANAERVLVEYNGMWMLDSLYMNMPPRWAVYQEFMFADGRSFLNYNNNMRQLCYDKLKSCELIVFNRFPKDADIMPYHKIVRAANRACDIAYEGVDGNVKYDDIVDPLPFDKNAELIEIADKDYALWYRDLNEELPDYQGKGVRFKAQIALSDELESDELIVGRQMMTCCADDIAFAGLIAVDNSRQGLENSQWVMLSAKIEIGEHPGYDRPGPILHVREISPCEAPAEVVASFM